MTVTPSATESSTLVWKALLYTFVISPFFLNWISSGLQYMSSVSKAPSARGRFSQGARNKIRIIDQMSRWSQHTNSLSKYTYHTPTCLGQCVWLVDYIKILDAWTTVRGEDLVSLGVINATIQLDFTILQQARCTGKYGVYREEKLHVEKTVKGNPSHDQSVAVLSTTTMSLQLPQAAIGHYSMGSLTPNPATVP
ncbi:hypothetical protein An07g08180 [Aspergillus niger]|uniref:Uncharacterized protein n=2 Tax=Aspergillus niger TaxID=5061 RepID=A2QP47_ASPNC|nr:hypothetical protein An07g08180 [Aspergillus niger]CAK39634.1 hypothetical protein An07g08180 [Aspergillus niger]